MERARQRVNYPRPWGISVSLTVPALAEEPEEINNDVDVATNAPVAISTPDVENSAIENEVQQFETSVLGEVFSMETANNVVSVASRELN